MRGPACNAAFVLQFCSGYRLYIVDKSVCKLCSNPFSIPWYCCVKAILNVDNFVLLLFGDDTCTSC